jgi:nicotinamidase-related amidase
MTHMCVNSTARGAFNLGYAPTVVANATATGDIEKLIAVARPHPEVSRDT